MLNDTTIGIACLYHRIREHHDLRRKMGGDSKYVRPIPAIQDIAARTIQLVFVTVEVKERVIPRTASHRIVPNPATEFIVAVTAIN